LETDVIIIDYGMGNLFSVRLACEKVGLSVNVSSSAKDILAANGVILPGVGAFGDAMDNLKRLDLISPIKDFIKTAKPFLGICLGMQLLLSESEEFGFHKGLDVIPGQVIRFPEKTRDNSILKVPQVGWNQICQLGEKKNNWVDSPLNGIADGEYMYFVHSYYADIENKEHLLSESKYCGFSYASSLQKGSLFACQFHPEKSGNKGLTIYRNWSNFVSQTKEGK
jgi:imidazole glycerol-phosphate synthase subunit HisH